MTMRPVSQGPLVGKRILVTRPRVQADDLMDRLASLGAQPVVFPTVEIVPLADPSRLDRAVAELASYDWLIFTSVNGVSAFWERLASSGQDANALQAAQVAAIGPATARALQARGVTPDFVPQEYVAERIPDGLGEVDGRRILLPRADLAREALADVLRQRGAHVDEIVAYHTRPATPSSEEWAELRRGVDAATFTSASTVRNFVRLLGDETAAVLNGAHVVCIGPITAEAAREAGLRVEAVAEAYTTEGLVEALDRLFGERMVTN